VKVVYNACHGGFSLSHKAMLRIAELKGVKLWPQKDERFRSIESYTYWTVPPDKWVKELSPGEWSKLSVAERQAHNVKWEGKTVDWVRDIKRSDPQLVQAVEELGDEANGAHAVLRVAEVHGKYHITEYDGYESVETPDDIDWEEAQ